MLVLNYIRYKIVDWSLDISGFFILLAQNIADEYEYTDKYGEKDGYKSLVQTCDYKIGKFSLSNVISSWDVDYWSKKLGYNK